MCSTLLEQACSVRTDAKPVELDGEWTIRRQP